MQRKALGALGVVLAVGAAGCGSSKLTKAEFTRQANAVCTNAAAETGHAKANTIEGLAAKAIAFEHAKAAGIGKLAPPGELQDRYDAYTRAVAARLVVFEQFSQTVSSKQSTQTLQAKLIQLQDNEDSAAAALGLTACREKLHRAA